MRRCNEGALQAGALWENILKKRAKAFISLVVKAHKWLHFPQKACAGLIDEQAGLWIQDTVSQDLR